MKVNLPIAILNLFYVVFVIISIYRFFRLIFNPNKTKISILYYIGLLGVSIGRVITFSFMAFMEIVNKEYFYLAVTVPEMIYLCECLVLLWHFLSNYISSRINVSDDIEVFSNEDVPKIQIIINYVIYLMHPFYIGIFICISILNIFNKLSNKSFSRIMVGFNFLTTAIAIGFYIFLLIKLSGRPYKDINNKNNTNKIFLVIIIWMISRIINGVVEIIVYKNYSITFIYNELIKNENAKNAIMVISYFIVIEFIPLYFALDSSIYSTFVTKKDSDIPSDSEGLIENDNKTDIINKPDVSEVKKKYLLDIKDIILNEDTSINKKNGLGRIMIAKYKEQEVIVREIIFERLSRYDLEGILSDIELIYSLSHKNIAPIIGLCKEINDKILIVSPYYSNGTLYELIHEKNATFAFKNKVNLLINILNGIQYLNDNKIYHCHLSSKNIIIDDEEIPKIIDYGFDNLRETASIFNKYINKNAYTCPELLIDNKKIGHKLDNHPNNNYDIYSFGILMWEIFEEKIPLNIKLNELVKLVATDKCRPEITSMTDHNIEKLIRLCWDSDPSKRPSFNLLFEELNKLL